VRKDKTYPRVRLGPKSIRLIVEEMIRLAEDPKKPEFMLYRIATIRNEEWHLDTLDEFLSRLGEGFRNATLVCTYKGVKLDIRMQNSYEISTNIVVESKLEIITKLFNFIEEYAEHSVVPKPPLAIPPPKPTVRPTIFVGHGGSVQWRDLKDHLHEHHGYEVVAYETGERAGHQIRDVVEEMLHKASIAILVMTGEDQQADGSLRARQNVVHELGLFQGRLGFTKAVVLLENGTDSFSNINGVHQIRYSRGNIKETFGDVLSFLRRES
jgi:predicted nucleotide-binding protein